MHDSAIDQACINKATNSKDEMYCETASRQMAEASMLVTSICQVEID